MQGWEGHSCGHGLQIQSAAYIDMSGWRRSTPVFHSGKQTCWAHPQPAGAVSIGWKGAIHIWCSMLCGMWDEEFCRQKSERNVNAGHISSQVAEILPAGCYVTRGHKKSPYCSCGLKNNDHKKLHRELKKRHFVKFGGSVEGPVAYLYPSHAGSWSYILWFSVFRYR